MIVGLGGDIAFYRWLLVQQISNLFAPRYHCIIIKLLCSYDKLFIQHTLFSFTASFHFVFWAHLLHSLSCVDNVRRSDVHRIKVSQPEAEVLWNKFGLTIMGGRTSKLSSYDIEHLLQTTSFTRSQIKSWHRGFMVGKISKLFVYIVFQFTCLANPDMIKYVAM